MVKRGRGSAVYSIHSRSTPRTLQSVIHVDGNPKSTTLYRTEFFGILGAIVVVHHLLSVSGDMRRNLTGTLWCNNKAAVNKYNKLDDNLPFSLTEVKELDADVLQELQHWKSKPVKIIARWVKVHQHNPTTREARLNNVVYRLASTQHSKVVQWASRKRARQLPNTRAQLVLI